MDFDELLKRMENGHEPKPYLFNEGQRQALLLACAHLAVERPGWNAMLLEMADVLNGRDLFDEFKRLGASN